MGVPSAGASTGRRWDTNDTAGRLDIRMIAHEHERLDGQRHVTHEVRTWKAWRSRLLARDATEIDFWFSLDGDPSPERVVYVKFRKRRLVAEYNRYIDHGDGAAVGFLRRVRVERRGSRGVRVFVPRKALARRRDTYTWWVTTYFRGRDGSVCRSYYKCADAAPNRDGFAHDL